MADKKKTTRTRSKKTTKSQPTKGKGTSPAKPTAQVEMFPLSEKERVRLMKDLVKHESRYEALLLKKKTELKVLNADISSVREKIVKLTKHLTR